MKYALLVYDRPGSWRELDTAQRKALHGEYGELAESPGLITHFRLRPRQTAATIRIQDDEIVKTEGPLDDTRERFFAIYLLENDDRDAVLELAARIPAARTGGAVEVWPLIEH
jgi:hypothetical protein